MAKLYFRYGAMGSAKTLNLLAVAHSYEQQGKRVFIMKPALDSRFGRDLVRSRAGLEREADLLLEPDTQINIEMLSEIDCILVDEAQFLTPAHVDQLRQISWSLAIPVLCYGLRTDFRRELFAGTKRLFEVADAIDEVKTTCAFCNKKAVFNLKFLNGKATLAGPTIDLGSEEKYQPACAGCYEAHLHGTVHSNGSRLTTQTSTSSQNPAEPPTP